MDHGVHGREVVESDLARDGVGQRRAVGAGLGQRREVGCVLNPCVGDDAVQRGSVQVRDVVLLHADLVSKPRRQLVKSLATSTDSDHEDAMLDHPLRPCPADARRGAGDQHGLTTVRSVRVDSRRNSMW
ncbi:uncharacterized protein PpBr36_09574 [Pyricularia pennisetigena]|uniref:uncharacterized protein n=1 Tax=Pyricularia pennisetigena TaxID=1578925 RepID=UPI0011523657|nr:uncharacterized protein PpBr36_09574 [Pyricularia pennisetigena]TLS21637.1 hypothetical protein PpBr36_09574 [Pyricularia pennisetigena]